MIIRRIIRIVRSHHISSLACRVFYSLNSSQQFIVKTHSIRCCNAVAVTKCEYALIPSIQRAFCGKMTKLMAHLVISCLFLFPFCHISIALVQQKPCAPKKKNHVNFRRNGKLLCEIITIIWSHYDFVSRPFSVGCVTVKWGKAKIRSK